jgi:hypothetical protein
VAGISAKLPAILPFAIRDYDAHYGFDGLAARNRELEINETKHLFVEFKLELKTDFDHSFDRLEAIICWNSRVKHGESVMDLAGVRGTYNISPTPEGTKKRFIMVPGSARNVEVIVFRELLEQQGHKFRAVGD